MAVDILAVRHRFVPARYNQLLVIALVSLVLAAAPIAAAPQGTPKWTERARFAETHARAYDIFGTSVAVYGDLALVGVPRDDIQGTDSGTVYVYVRSGTSWNQEAILVASDGFDQDWFGYSLALEGNTAVVGAPRDHHVPGSVGSWGAHGSAYVFTRDGTTWTERAKLVASDAWWGYRYGFSVAISGDRILVGAPKKDHTASEVGGAYVYGRAGTTWTEHAILLSNEPQRDDHFGESVAIDGGTLVVGAMQDVLAPGTKGSPGGEGSAHVFVETGTAWTHAALLTASTPKSLDRFGVSVALEGDTLLVGADRSSGQGPGKAFVFGRAGTVWTQLAELQPPVVSTGERFGGAVALSGPRAVVSAWGHKSPTAAGQAFIYERGATWSKTANITPAVVNIAAFFGSSIALNGGTVIGGADAEDHGFGPFDMVVALAHDPTTGVLYATDKKRDLLLSVDPEESGATPIGATGFGNVQGLAFDVNRGLLFGSDLATGQLITLDTTTGVGTAVGPIGFASVRSLAHDPGADVLYGVDDVTDDLLTLDPTTGAATVVGNTGLDTINGLAFVPFTNTLYGNDNVPNNLVSLDTTTGLATTVTKTSKGAIEGLADDPANFQVFASNISYDYLLRVHLGHGTASNVGPFGEFTNAGAAYLFEYEGPCAFCTSYCTAGTSAGGCTPMLSAEGTASASAAFGFALRADGSPGAKPGLFFYGANGRQAVQWGNGTSYQCVTPPVQRAGPSSVSGNAGACDGSFTEDLNALWSNEPKKSPRAGAVVQTQFWYLDRQNTSNRSSGLSNALELTVTP